MSKGAGSPPRIDQLFAGPGARGDQWTNLVELAEAWADNSGGRAKFDEALADMAATEEFHAYPGSRLIAALRDRAAANDAQAAAGLARRIARAVLTRSFRHDPSVWDEHEDDESLAADVLPPTLGQVAARRPYFEVLIVTGAPAARWPALIAEWRRLRRPLDAFVYEPVFVGSFEDAFCATLLNPDLAAVVIHEGFPFRSRHDAPVLRSLIEAAKQRKNVRRVRARSCARS